MSEMTKPEQAGVWYTEDGWHRACPSCGKIAVSTSKEWAVKAAKRKKRCFTCVVAERKARCGAGFIMRPEDDSSHTDDE